MKTKKFLLATAGSTVDGRTIDDKLITEMASSYDPKTYGARLNIEHIRGLGTEGPFRSYGDVIELSTGEVEVNFNGSIEKRLGLYGIFDVDDSAKQLNDAGQKVYPSIEIQDNFAGKDFAYMVGCALTDSPAAIGTERMKFNRQLPGTINLTAENSGIDAALLEFAENDAPADPVATGFFAAATDFFKQFTPGEPKKPVIEPKPDDQPADLNQFIDQFSTMFGDFAKKVDAGFAAQSDALSTAIGKVDARCTELSNSIENTEKPGQPQRSQSNGENFTKTDC